MRTPAVSHLQTIALCYLNGRFHRKLTDSSILLLAEDVGTTLTIGCYQLTLTAADGRVEILDPACGTCTVKVLQHNEMLSFIGGIWHHTSMLQPPRRAA